MATGMVQTAQTRMCTNIWCSASLVQARFVSTRQIEFVTLGTAVALCVKATRLPVCLCVKFALGMVAVWEDDSSTSSICKYYCKDTQNIQGT